MSSFSRKEFLKKSFLASVGFMLPFNYSNKGFDASYNIKGDPGFIGKILYGSRSVGKVSFRHSAYDFFLSLDIAGINRSVMIKGDLSYNSPISLAPNLVLTSRKGKEYSSLNFEDGVISYKLNGDLVKIDVDEKVFDPYTGFLMANSFRSSVPIVNNKGSSLEVSVLNYDSSVVSNSSNIWSASDTIKSEGFVDYKGLRIPKKVYLDEFKVDRGSLRSIEAELFDFKEV